MKATYDQISKKISKNVTRKYSTSFSLGISFLHKEIQDDVYNLYGFVRLADEVVDSFHGYDQEKLLSDLKDDTYKAISQKISTNPVLHSFQETFHKYDFPVELVDQFLYSMEMDLNPDLKYDKDLYDEYIVGSAEVVGLMCLLIFLDGDKVTYNELEPYARSLGSAFQKINFLRDLKQDFEDLGRTYFPGVDFSNFTNQDKKTIQNDIEQDFAHAYIGIKKLPKKARFGVYLAYIYYIRLFNKIEKLDATVLLNERVRISDNKKYGLFVSSYLRNSLNLV